MKTAIIFSLLIMLAVVLIPTLKAGWLDDWAKMEPIKPRYYVCYQTTVPIVIDGKLTEDSWRNAAWTEDFVDIQGVRPRPRQEILSTHAKMLWDDEYFYVGAELEEPHVWGTLTQHDSVIFQDNDFEIFIDPTQCQAR